MNTQGTDFWGRNYTIAQVPVPNGTVLPLWVAVVIPPTTVAGTYRGTASLTFDGKTTIIRIKLHVGGAVLPDGGDGDITRGTRLHWLDSTLGQWGDTVPSPYIPIKLRSADTGTTISLLGKRITIAPSGLLSDVLVIQDRARAPLPSVTPRVVMARPGMTFDVDGLRLEPPQLKIGRASKMSVAWESTARDQGDAGSVTVAGTLDCTGYALINITVSAHKAIANAGVSLSLSANPHSSFFAMGLGRQGGLIDNWAGAAAAVTDVTHSWITVDFGHNVSLDGVRLYSAGDKVHDVTESFLQAATLNSEPTSIVWSKIASRFHTVPGTKLPQEAFFPVTKARIWRWVTTNIVHTKLCQPVSTHCQPNVAEIEFHKAGAARTTWMRNNDTASNSLVIDSSGGNDSQNGAWAAMDGLLIYQDFKYGWDAGQMKLPDPPTPVGPPPPAGPQKVSWKWDHKNGNNGVWFGSTKAGIRFQLKGEDPLWWAGSPYDSGTSPQPPQSWSNAGAGGIDAWSNGTATAFSGSRTMSAGDTISYVLSVMITPVRPFDFEERVTERWAQLNGPNNYTSLAESGVTVVNMHQGESVIARAMLLAFV
jgi:hypothetical protein